MTRATQRNAWPFTVGKPRLGGVTSTNDIKWLAAELRKFTNFLMQLCPKHRIQHLAFAFSKDKPDNPAIVKEADVTCIRLY